MAIQLGFIHQVRDHPQDLTRTTLPPISLQNHRHTMPPMIIVLRNDRNDTRTNHEEVAATSNILSVVRVKIGRTVTAMIVVRVMAHLRVGAALNAVSTMGPEIAPQPTPLLRLDHYGTVGTHPSQMIGCTNKTSTAPCVQTVRELTSTHLKIGNGRKR